MNLESDAKLTVPLADWLAVGCQKIRWEEAGEESLLDGACGIYHSNSHLAFGAPYDESVPFGPSVYVGEIILPLTIRSAFRSDLTPKKIAALVETFQFIVAHELIHVCDILTYLVPAFMDWRAFWKNVLNEGEATDLFLSRIDNISSFVVSRPAVD
jgi:hypothetical protein